MQLLISDCKFAPQIGYIDYLKIKFLKKERERDNKQHLRMERVLSGDAVKMQKEKHHMPPDLNKDEGLSPLTDSFVNFPGK